MAGYTTPKTWISSDLESVTDWNTYVRDDENSIRQFMYLPSRYSDFQFNLVGGANLVYTSPDLLLAAPAEGWTFWVMVAFGCYSTLGAHDIVNVLVKDRAGASFSTQPSWFLLEQGSAAYTPICSLQYINYPNAGASQIPKFSVTLQLNTGTVGRAVGVAFPYAVPLSQ